MVKKTCALFAIPTIAVEKCVGRYAGYEGSVERLSFPGVYTPGY
jgi:hypothetical protein